MVDWIYPTDQRYDSARVISNARLDFRPSAICYAESETDVVSVLRSGGCRVRVRSGGHNHEGMCSGDETWIVDVSKLDTISINGTLMTVGPGARLKNVYDACWANRALLPGGGCGDVCIGGLVQGAGWGPYSRAFGLTCDRLVGFRLVKAGGQVVDINRGDGQVPDPLFWAVAGAGGGNFGVITQLRFLLYPLGDSPIHSFTVSWSSRGLYAEVADDWGSHFPFDDDPRLTSFCRLTALAGGASLDQPVVVSGNFIGYEHEIEGILGRLLPNTWSKKSDLSITRIDEKQEGRHVLLHPDYQPGPPADAVQGDLGNTCAGVPFPHKVSSCFPQTTFGAHLDKVAEYLGRNDPEPTARRYLSLHSFGGAIQHTNPWSCFAWRDKPFLLQYQAWWGNAERKDVERRCIDWIRGFREELRDCTEGSFINFPDLELGTDRRTLLRSYYRDDKTLDQLIAVKRTYDQYNLFDFPMGIPTT